MCGGFGGGSSNNDQGRIIAGGRGSNIAVRRKSKTAQTIQNTMAGIAGSMLFPGGGLALTEASKRANTAEFDLRTGVGTAQKSPGGLGKDSARDKARDLLASAQGSAQGTPKEKAAKIMTDTQDKRKKAKAKVSAGPTKRSSTLLAGRKIAEDKLKTALGQ